MTRPSPAAIDRMRIHRSQQEHEVGPYDSGDRDFEHDALKIIDAYLAEHDPTPMRPQHFAGQMTHDLPGGRCLCLDWYDGQCQVFFRQPAIDGGFDYVELMVLKTVGQYRTLLRAFGIEVGG